MNFVHYLFTIKANQPTLLERCAALAWHNIPIADRTRDRAHGRVEIRTPQGHHRQPLRLPARRPGPAAHLQGLRPSTRKWHTMVVYAITSLSFQQTRPRLADLIRGHWTIENGLHWVRDVTFAEDASQLRAGTAPQVMASLRNLAIVNLAAALRRHARDPARPLTTLGSTSDETDITTERRSPGLVTGSTSRPTQATATLPNTWDVPRCHPEDGPVPPVQRRGLLAERVPTLSSMSDRLDTTTWHIARVYDWWLGGKDNFPADRAQGQAILQVYPGARREARNNRAFMREAVRRMARAGVRQFLDIGAGIPTSPNLYEVAQSFDPTVRVVYVDNDPLVLVHARALMTGATDYIDADLREPEKILEEARQTLDFAQPVGLTLISILHFLDEEEPYNDKPYEIMARLLEPLVSGSYLAISHGTYDLFSDELRKHMRDMAKASRRPFGQRTKTQIARFFDGLDMVPPGLVPLHEWLPEEDPDYPEPEPVEPGTEGYYAGLARVR